MLLTGPSAQRLPTAEFLNPEVRKLFANDGEGGFPLDASSVPSLQCDNQKYL